jgi:hypothetical protein
MTNGRDPDHLPLIRVARGLARRCLAGALGLLIASGRVHLFTSGLLLPPELDGPLRPGAPRESPPTAGPPPGHPERRCPEPLSAAERHLWAQLVDLD